MRGVVWEGEIFGAVFSKKVPFLANIECCPQLLEYALTIGFIIYKHSTHTKLYRLASGSSEEKLSTPRVTQENPELCPTTSFLDQHQKQTKKIHNLGFTQHPYFLW